MTSALKRLLSQPSDPRGQEIILFFQQTGYQVKKITHLLDPELETLRQQNAGKQNISVQYGRMHLHGLTQDELSEICARQLLVLATPR